MKRIITLTLVCLFTLGLTATAKAVVLDPGDTAIATQGVTSPGVTELASLVIPFSKKGTNGTFYQWVRTGPNGIVFEYMVDLDGGGTYYPGRIAATDFIGWVTDVDAKNTSGDEVASTMGRDPSGATVSFDYPGYIYPTENTSIMWVATNAPTFGLNSNVYVQNGEQAAFTTYGPRVPEPASMALMGIGLMGLCGSALRKRRMKKRFQA